METKALKKQLGAAIAMIVVAAIALGSATYAWFATNSTVKATTTTISAKSNAAFLTISADSADGKTAKSVNTTTAEKTTASTALYPATFTAKTTNNKLDNNQWQTGYGSAVDNAAINTAGLSACKSATSDDGTTDGTTAAAKAGDFILAQDYTVSSRGCSQTDLKVESVSVKENDTSTSDLKSALRVMITCGDVTNSTASSWVVYGWDSTASKYVITKSSEENDANPVLASEITAEQDTDVHVYLYYEGSDSNVTTKKLQDNKLTAANAVTVTLTATPNNK